MIILFLLLLLNPSNSIIIQVTNYTLQDEKTIQYDFETFTSWCEASERMKTGGFNFINITYTDDSERIDSVQDFPSLQYFWLERTEQVSIPVFTNLPKLSIVNLSKNYISFIKNNVVSTVPVMKMYLNNNNIKEIEDFSFGDNLEKLSLNFNSIKKVSSKWFKKPEQLVFLYLVGNDIESVRKDDFKDFVNIKKLLLGFNKIKTIENGSFGFVKYFIKLSLDYNELKEMNENIFGDAVKIDKLYFSYNHLMYLSDEFLKRVEVVEQFWVYGNPWLCSCVEKINKSVSAEVIDWGDKFEVTDDVKTCEISTKKLGSCQPTTDDLRRVIIGDVPITKERISDYSSNTMYYPCTKMNSCILM